MTLRRAVLWSLTCLGVTFAGAAVGTLQDACGPFTDVSVLFCPYVLEAYYTGITVGTSPSTFSPDLPITRGQAAVFTTKALNQALARGSRRAALGQWWTTQGIATLGLTPVTGSPFACACDGADVWVSVGNSVSRVRASDGAPLESWSCPAGAMGLVVAMGRVFVAVPGSPGGLAMIDPTQPAGVAVTVANDLGANPQRLAFDGGRIWSANAGGSVSIVTPGAGSSWSTTTVAGFNTPEGILYDGANIWVTDFGAGTLLKLDSAANVLQTITIGGIPEPSVFDGANIWVPSFAANSLTVVQASTGQILASLTGNGLDNPAAAAFDGERILVANGNGDHVTLWRAANFAPLGSFPTPTGGSPQGACSDGLNFWITLLGTGQLARF
jgi:S-layer family protein